MSLSTSCGRRAPFVLAALVLALSVVLAACGKGKTASDPSQIAATVNGEEVSVHQVRALLKRQPAGSVQGQKAADGALDSLIEQELAAQAARKAGLDKSPDVIQSLELAKREVLARAYQEQLASKATQPDTEAAQLYYDKHPELFARRKLYTLTETVVSGSPSQLASVQSRIEQQGSVDAVHQLLAAANLDWETRTFTLLSEEVPMDLLAKLVYLKDGQSVGVPQPQGLAVLTVVHTEDRPMTRGEAIKRISVVMFGDKRKQAVESGMADLRKDARITRNPPFSAPMAASAASGPASTAHP